LLGAPVPAQQRNMMFELRLSRSLRSASET